MKNPTWRWFLGLSYILAVAVIWIAASFVVQEVVDEGVSPFLVTYICNSLFVLYIPIIEIVRYLEDKHGGLLFWRKKGDDHRLHGSDASDQVILLDDDENANEISRSNIVGGIAQEDQGVGDALEHDSALGDGLSPGLDAKGRWTRSRVAKVGLFICLFWFLAQLTFNLSLKYTTVTSNTILSSTSSLFTFLVALLFLKEKFTWLKLISVLLCMGGTVVVSLGDSGTGSNGVASNPVLGDVLALISSCFYAVYITMIRIKLPDEDNEKQGQASMAQFLGFLGLFNILIFLPVALVLHFTRLEPIYNLSARQIGMITGKGLLDNVLSDYLWAKAVLLTTTTVATAGLSIQVPLAAIVDTLTGNTPNKLDYVGALSILIGFVGINIPSGTDSEAEQVKSEPKIEGDNPCYP